MIRLPLLAVGAVFGLGLYALVRRKGGVAAAVASVGRAAHVYTAFGESSGVRYSWSGGHPPGPRCWPKGSPGARGGVGFDCSGWVLNVCQRAPNPPAWAFSDIPSSTIWHMVGAPSGGTAQALLATPGDLIFFGHVTANGPQVVHVGFVTGPNGAVSAFGAGASVNADRPDACVKAHTWSGTGLTVIGTAPW